ncbi:hypothetical protein D3C71_308840 [compost metagenome]
MPPMTPALGQDTAASRPCQEVADFQCCRSTMLMIWRGTAMMKWGPNLESDLVDFFGSLLSMAAPRR